MKNILSGVVFTIFFTMFFTSLTIASSVYTDKPDYSPIETVIITGEGFIPNHEITVKILSPDSFVYILSSSTNSSGIFVTSFSVGLTSGTYFVNASDGTNWATTTFTDAVCSNIACTNDDPCYNRCDGSYWYYDGGDCKSSCPGTGSHCRYDNRICADSSSSDNFPDIGGIRTCSAACDQNSDCPIVCDGTKTKLGDCKSDCTCGAQSNAYCVKNSCGATCDNDDYCKCLGHKWAPSAACPSSSCSCNGQENAACKIGKCGAQCDATNPCPAGQTCDSDCQCIVTQNCGNGIVEGTEQCDGGVCCNADCTFKSVGTDCGLCEACNALGECNQIPADDSSCGTIDCDVFDTTCRNYDDLTSNRCSGFGTCKSENSADCTVYTNAAAGTDCGLCEACNALGECNQIPADDSSCGIIDCDVFDTTCRNYDDLTSNRCLTFGACKSATLGNCIVYTNAGCQLPGTDNNDNCPQTTTGCLQKKTGTRDNKGFCDASCGCVSDSFSYSCVKDSCGAVCDSNDDCNDGNSQTTDTCNLDTCSCENISVRVKAPSMSPILMIMLLGSLVTIGAKKIKP